MATRMQQRRGTAQQWTDADPILAAGEIGFETDTNQFKIGDGVNAWSVLSYFKNLEDLGGSLDDYILLTQKGAHNGVAELDNTGNVPISQLGNLIDGAPELLNTINELADAIANDATFANTVLMSVDAAQAAAQGFTTNAIGVAISTEIENRDNAISAAIEAEVISRDAAITDALNDGINAHNATVNVHGIADTSLLVTETALTDATSEITEAYGNAIVTHAGIATNVHGIADTSALATMTYADSAASNAQSAAESTAAGALSSHASDTTDIHGIANTAALATKSYADNAVSTHEADTTNVHGIADTSALATKTYADSAVSTHNSGTTNVHGIADTSALATKTYADGAASNAQSAAESTAASALASHEADTTNIHGIANTALLVTTTGTQTLTNKTITSPSGLVKADVGLGNVDNTSDANKPVSSATQTALDLKAPLASPTLTGNTTVSNLTISGNLVVNGTTTTVDSQNLSVTDPLVYIGTGNSANSKDLGVVGHFDDGTYQHTGIVRDATDGKWKLFSGVTTEPSDTIDFATYTKDTLVIGALEATSATIGNVSNTELQYLDGVTSAIQTQLDAKAPLASPTFTGNVTLPANTVSTSMIQDSAITSAKIADGTIVNADINASAAIATSKISGLDSALSAKAPIDAPTFTNLVTVASAGIAFTDGTQTKEGVVSRTPIVQKTASYTLSALTERDSMIEVANASATTITIPTNATVAFPVGTSIDILQTSTGQVTIAGAAGVTVNATPGLKLRTQWSGATLFKRATDTWVVYGDLSA
jgi:hypothetical protein